SNPGSEALPESNTTPESNPGSEALPESNTTPESNPGSEALPESNTTPESNAGSTALPESNTTPESNPGSEALPESNTTPESNPGSENQGNVQLTEEEALSAIETSFNTQLNEYRKSLNAPALSVDKDMSIVAQDRANRAANGQILVESGAHKDYVSDIDEQLKKSGLESVKPQENMLVIPIKIDDVRSGRVSIESAAKKILEQFKRSAGHDKIQTDRKMINVGTGVAVMKSQGFNGSLVVYVDFNGGVQEYLDF
ncbi:CAP domain-containing protein, partial [Weissella uvarum]